LRVLVGCEYSGVVRDAFLAKGHDAMSCDFHPTEAPGPHYQGDIRDLLDGWQPVVFADDALECECCDEPYCPEHETHYADCFCIGPTQDGIEYIEKNGRLFGRPIDNPHWDLAIFHPDCTYLCSSGLHWNGRVEGRQEKTEEALHFVQLLMDAPIEKIALENPIGCIGTRIRKPDQFIQPHEYGHDASKKTCLWLKNLPKLVPTHHVAPRIIDGKPRWGNQCDSGQNKLGPSPDRWKERSRTYLGWGKAFAEQWG